MMKYVSPKYEISLLEASDIIMSGEGYIINESTVNGEKIGDVVIDASGIFTSYFNKNN